MIGRETGQLFDNRYQLRDLLGEGGMSFVYLAEDIKLDRIVALKLIKASLRKSSVKSADSLGASEPLSPQQSLIKRDVDALKQLAHAHIVALYDARLDVEEPYLVTQYVRGGTLANKLVSGNVLSRTQQMRILEQLCDAIDYLHGTGQYTNRFDFQGFAPATQAVLHLDLKPANILFHESGQDIAITDFGLSSIGITTAKGHSYEYSAPEVRSGQDVDPRADIYSIGVIAWHLLTGFLPSRIESTSRISPEMTAVLQKAMAKTPAERFSSANELWQAILTAYDAPAPPHPGHIEPYKGLVQFEYDDDHIFFGRTALIGDIITHLHLARFLAILGSSGSGKSSVMRAGVLPLLQKGLAYRSPVPLPERSNYWRYCTITPKKAPLVNLLNALLPERDRGDTPTPIDQLDTSKIIAQTRHTLEKNDHLQLLLFVDQFEELFALNSAYPETQEKFIEILLAVANCDLMQVVIAMRFDFMQQVAAHPQLEQAIRSQNNHLIVTQLKKEELREVIELPAENGDWSLQTGLAEQMLEDVGQEAGALPLLSHALLETWKRRRWRTMTLDAYREIGGVQQAITKTAEASFTALPENQQTLARTVLLRLVKLGEGTPDTRQRVAVSELNQLAFAKPDIDFVLQVLAEKRLIVIDKDLDGNLAGDDYLELSHEALIRYWPRLRNEIDENREQLRKLGRLQQQAREWADAERDPSLFLRGKALVEALGMVQNSALDMELTSVEREFVIEGETAEKAAEAKEKELLQERAAAMEEKAVAVESEAKTLRRALVIGSVLLLAAVIAAIIAVNRQNVALDETAARATSEAVAIDREGEANEARTTAVFNESLAVTRELEANEARATAVFNENLAAANEAEAIQERDRANSEAQKFLAQSLAAQSEIVQESDPQLSLLLAVEAANVHAKIDEPVIEPAMQALRDSLGTIGGIGLSGHMGYVADIAFSPDGNWFATMDNLAGEIRVWNLTQENPAMAPMVLQGHEDAVSAMAFSPDSQWLVSAGGGNLNTSTSILDAIFNYRLDLRYGAVDGFDTAIRLWNLHDGGVVTLPETPFHDDNGFISYVTFIANGSRLVSIDTDGTVLLWDITNLADPPPPQRLAQLSGGLVTAVTSPDSRWLVLTDLGGTLYRWDLLAEELDLSPETVEITSGLFRPLAFSPDGTLLATGDGDGHIQLWDFTSEELTTAVAEEYTLENEISQLAFSPDGKWFAAGTRTGEVLIWPFRPDMFAEDSDLLDTKEAIIAHLEFSPDGNWLIVNYDQVERSDAWGTFELWPIGEDGPGETPEQIYAHELRIPAVTFSPDGAWLASSSFDGTARLWRFGAFAQSAHADTLNNSHYRLDPQEAILAAGFDPESKWLITSDLNGDLRLWPIANLENTSVGFSDIPYTELEGHDARVVKMAVSPDGLFATGSVDGMIRLTEISEDGSATSTIFSAHDDEISALIFSDDGSLLISSGYDNTVQIWDVSQKEFVNEPLTLEPETTILTVALDPTGHWLAGGGVDAQVHLWDLQAADPAASMQSFDGHDLEITVLDISSDGRWLATGSGDATIRLWDLQADNIEDSVEVLRGHTDFVVSLAFSDDGRWLATGSSDKTARLWQFVDGKVSEESFVLSGHSTLVFNLAFSPDGRHLYTSDISGLIQSWDLTQENPAQTATQFSANNRPIGTIAISPDNRWLFSGGQDGKTQPGGSFFITSMGVPRLWPLQTDILIRMACETAGRNLTFDEYATYFPDKVYSLTCAEFGVHPSVLETAREAAISGDRSKALSLFTLARDLDEQLQYEPNVEADRWLAQGMLEEARLAARNLEMEEATQLFTDALALDPSLGFEPEAEAKRFAAPEYAWEAFQAAANDNIVEALDLMEVALSYNPELNRLPEGVHSSASASTFTPRERLASGYHLLCTRGIYAGLLDKVLFYCEESVRLDPDPAKGYLHEGRGMARTISGDFAGAVVDIDLYITWLETLETKTAEATAVHWQQLRDEIVTGQNPFDDTFFAALNSRRISSEEAPSTWVQVSPETFGENSIQITIGMPIEGAITYNDYKDFTDETYLEDVFADLYVLTVNGGDTIIVVIEAEKNGSELDSYLWLLDAELTQLRRNDDSFGVDSSLTYTFDQDGTYYLLVRDYQLGAYGDSTNFYYTLRTELLPGPIPLVNPTTIAQYAEPLTLGVVQFGAVTKEDYKALLIGGVDETQYRFGDFYQVQLEAGTTISAQTKATAIGSALDTIIYIYDDEYNFLDVAATEEDAMDAALSFDVPETGTYYLFIRDSNRFVFGQESEYFYQLIVE